MLIIKIEIKPVIGHRPSTIDHRPSVIGHRS